jgi:hypothetical protein
MLAYPTLINRPFAITSSEARLRRPSEVVLDILFPPDRGFLAKKDGEAALSGPLQFSHRHLMNPRARVGARGHYLNKDRSIVRTISRAAS